MRAGMISVTAFVFVDTGVLVHARDPRDATKHTAAAEWLRLLWQQERGRTSVQVLNDYFAVVSGKFHPTVRRDDAWEDVELYLSAWNPQAIDSETLACARDVEMRHHLGWSDCLVVAAAQVQNCVLLLSDALGDGANYGGVTVRSPVTLRVAAESSAYTLPPRPASRHRGRGRPRAGSST